MAECGICPHNCNIPEGLAGLCGIRENRNGKIVSAAYGVVSSLAIDPIEKKPLYRFHLGRPILSIGGFGCNLRCPFCQNHQIALSYEGISGRSFSPEDIAAAAKQIPGNIGVAYTYNEPLINYEFLRDCADLVHNAGMFNVLVTNGFVNREPLEALLPFIDAMNIDLKGFTEEFYRSVGGRLQPVLDTIALAHKHCHVEVTTLIIPGENEEHIEPLAEWLAGLSAEIPLHISRFFPCHKYMDKQPTPKETIYRLCDIAKKHLTFVYPGNV